jgi:hypothetical protein
MGFVRVWMIGFYNPPGAFRHLKEKPAPWWGLGAVIVRFVGTSITTVLLLYLNGQSPFRQPSPAFLLEKNYYAMEIFFLPVYGVLVWLLMGAVAHLLFQLWEAGIECVGFCRLMKLDWFFALGLSLVVNALYILLAMVFIR